MPALPLEQRIERLPNWAQAYIGRLTRQILKLTDRANSIVVDPTPVFTQETVDGETIQNFLAMPGNDFYVEHGDQRYHFVLSDDGSLVVYGDKPMAVIPVAPNHFDVVPIKGRT